MKGVDCLSDLPALYGVGEAIKDTFSHKTALSAVRLSSFLFLSFPHSTIEIGDKLISCLDCSFEFKSPETCVHPVLKLAVTKEGKGDVKQL